MPKSIRYFRLVTNYRDVAVSVREWKYLAKGWSSLWVCNVKNLIDSFKQN